MRKSLSQKLAEQWSIQSQPIQTRAVENKGLKKRRAARKGYQKAKKKSLGEGSRFKAIEKSARVSGASNPAAVAASIMWKKYGKKKGGKIIAKGKKGKKGAKKQTK